MKIFYRISDESYVKDKLPGADKRRCLENFLSIFKPADVTILADNCHTPLLDWLDAQNLNVHETNMGNAGSFLHALDMACNTDMDGEVIYFVEDDYLHLPDAPKILNEGLRGDYVTLYDHPDKYGPLYNLGNDIESKVFRTPSSHWRTTISTCMTFAARVSTLKRDRGIFRENCVNNHPNDHEIFVELEKRGRMLVSSIPGAACHIDLTYSLSLGQFAIEPWAVEIIVKDARERLMTPATASIIEHAEKTLSGVELLSFLVALDGNMPFDQFTIEQLAGDLLPKPSQEDVGKNPKN
jgi:hypothetical protein